MPTNRRTVDVDPTELQTSDRRHGLFAGVEIVDGLAPEDIPQQVTVVTRENGHSIYFNYSMHFDEPKLTYVLEPGAIKGIVGQNSGRLYEINFPVNSPQSLLNNFRDVVTALTSKDRLARRRKHYEVAAEAVSDNAQKLFPGLFFPGVHNCAQ